MKIRIAFFLALLLIATGALSAQELSKAEKKEWKKIAKEYKRNPAALKTLTEERDLYREQVQQLRDELNAVDRDQGQVNRRIAQLEESNQMLNQQLIDAQQTIRELQMENDQLRNSAPARPQVNQPAGDMTSGVVYRIQVGAFGKGKVPASFLEYPDVMVEDAGNMEKVLVGSYRDYEAAKARVSELKAQGIQGPWIVPFRDGVRISLQEALQN